MMVCVLIIVGCLYCFHYVYKAYREQVELLQVLRQLLRKLRVGVCDQRLSIGEICDSDQRFSVMTDRTIYEYLCDHNDLLSLSDVTLNRFRFFEQESTYASAEQSSNLMNLACTEAEEQLLKSGNTLKARTIGMLTTLSAFCLIIIILVV